MSAEAIRTAFRAGELGFIDPEALATWITRQRWFGAKASEVVQVGVREAIPLQGDPPLAIAILEVRFPSGTHDLYQVPIGLRPASEGGEAIFETGGWLAQEALEDPAQALRLGQLLGRSAVIEQGPARLEFNALPGGETLASASRVRPIGREQSNSSLVFGEQVVLKVFRQLGAGINPELEMRRFLTERAFGPVAELLGWYEHRGELIDATLGVAERYVADARDGWELTLEALASGRGEEWLARLAELGTVSAELHSVLGSDFSDPDFAPQEPTMEAMALAAAAIDAEIERTFSDLPDDPALTGIAGRGEEVREYARLVAQGGGGGLLIRNHGDLHLGQTMLAPTGWMIVDFEGEPARPLHERRVKRSALRDVAGMLRSFAYAAGAVKLQHAVGPPAGWEQRARRSFLDAYTERVDPALLPADATTLEQMLTLFELEKAVYELGYEIDHRPDWVPIPAVAIERLLEGMAR